MNTALLFASLGIALLVLIALALYNWPPRGADSPNVLHAERCGGVFGGPLEECWLRIPRVNLCVMRWGVDIAYSTIRLRIPFESITAVSVERMFLFTKAVRIRHECPDVPENLRLFAVKSAPFLTHLIQSRMTSGRP